MFGSLSLFRPFMYRSIDNSKTYNKIVLLCSVGIPSFQASTATSGVLNTAFLGFRCQFPKTVSLDLTVCKANRIIFFSRLSKLRCYSSFNVKSLWEEEKTNSRSKLEIKPTGNDTTAEKSTLVKKYSSDKQEEILSSELEKVHNQTENGNIDWNKIKNLTLEVKGCIDEENINAVIMKNCCETKSFRLGKSFFKYLKSSHSKINRATYGNYLRLFYHCSKECSEKDLDEIFEVYKEVQEVYDVLDTNTAEKVILALSITKHWKEYVKLFEVIERIYFPTSMTYAAVIKAAFKNGELKLGWSLMEEMQFRGILIYDDVFDFVLNTTQGSTKDEVFIKVLDFMSKFNIKPSVSFSEILKQTFEGISKDRRGVYTTVLRSGTCKHCDTDLERARVSSDDYEELKTAFLDPVLIGKDIFQKTKPEEFKEFLSFLEKTAPFDVVLDGLNIAFKSKKHQTSTSSYAFQLKSVVEHFVSMQCKVLVLGRKHMTKWKTEDMRYIYSNADVFFAEDMSQDDPFLLYATLYSGLGTRFVSQDMMRGHKFLLANKKLQTTFQLWQAQHQYFINYIENNGNVYLRDPVPFVQNIQRSHCGDWHIPYVRKEVFTNKTVVDNFHRHWLCLTTQPPLQARPVGVSAGRNRFQKRY